MALTDLLELRTLINEHELYEVDYGGSLPTQYHTTQSHEVVIPLAHALTPPGAVGDTTYVPTPAARDELETNIKLNGGSLSLGLPSELTNLKTMVIDGGLHKATLRIIRGWGDPLNAPENFQRYWFIGELTETQTAQHVLICTFKDGTYNFENIESPRARAQRTCNHDVFDDNCKLTEVQAPFLVEEVLDNGKRIRVTDQSGFPLISGSLKGDVPGDYTVDPFIPPVSGYFTLGKIRDGSLIGQKTFITAHTVDAFGNIFFDLQFAFTGSAGAILGASWGCDKLIRQTCIPKFLNRLNAHAMPDMPIKNPALIRTFNL